MNTKEADDFYLAALSYCRLIEKIDVFIDNNLIKLINSLLDIYSKAILLPDIQSNINEECNFEITIPQINFGNYEFYWEVFNPYHLDETVSSSLSDDIVDIYKDVKKGLILFDKNEHKEAIWQWKFSFDIHWGSHAVDAIRALHYVIRS
jgi:hypothetical protein